MFVNPMAQLPAWSGGYNPSSFDFGSLAGNVGSGFGSLPELSAGFDPGSLVATTGPSIDAAVLGNGNYSIAGGPGSGLGFNLDTAKLALAGLGTIGSLWSAFQQNKLAKKQFAFTKDITNTNLANQIKSYNTTLEDRARSRAAMEGQSTAQMQEYVNKNRLKRSGN